MPYCLKTGGIIIDESHASAMECDLHIEGDCLIAITCPSMDRHTLADGDKERITAFIPVGTDFFYRHHTGPFGVLVIEQRNVQLTQLMWEHIMKHYSWAQLQFSFVAGSRNGRL